MARNRKNAPSPRALNEELDHEFQFQIQSAFQTRDDEFEKVNTEAQTQHMLETLTRLGGEVCRMRSEVDELLEQNASLLQTFEKLRSVIDEKGALNLDDFDLACDVLETHADLKPQAVKKAYN